MNKQTTTNQGTVIPEQVEPTPFETLLPELREALSLLDDVYLAADPKFKAEVFKVWQSLNRLVNKHTSSADHEDKQPIPYVMTMMSEMFEQLDPAQAETAQVAASSTAFALGMYIASSFNPGQEEIILNSLIIMIQAGMHHAKDGTNH